MTSRLNLLRNLHLVRGSSHAPLAEGSSGSAGASRRRRSSHSALGAAGGAAAALVAVACAFGPLPEQASMRDATAGEAGVEVSRNTIDNFLSESRRYLGL